MGAIRQQTQAEVTFTHLCTDLDFIGSYVSHKARDELIVLISETQPTQLQSFAYFLRHDNFS